jgi:predicted GNAT family acetyltransferase
VSGAGSAVPGRVTDHPERSRYELDLNGETAFALYRSAPGVLTIYYTEVPRHLRGQGIGSILVRGVLQDIRAKGLKVIPTCGFVAGLIRDNPEFHDLLG